MAAFMNTQIFDMLPMPDSIFSQTTNELAAVYDLFKTCPKTLSSCQPIVRPQLQQQRVVRLIVSTTCADLRLYAAILLSPKSMMLVIKWTKTKSHSLAHQRFALCQRCVTIFVKLCRKCLNLPAAQFGGTQTGTFHETEI